LHWKPKWVERDDEEFKALVTERAAEKTWVADGSYLVVRDILWLNYSFPVVLYRAISRSFKRSMTKQILFSENRETFKQAFLVRNQLYYGL
jgi:hypothetical protein